MSLIEKFLTPCVMMEKTSAPDGEGGSISAWVDGDGFDAAVVFDNSLEARKAEKQGVTGLYTVTTGIALGYHDVFKRLSDEKVFRVTSNGNDKHPPACATFAFHQVTAEEWRLT